jgi:hypothetical protein
MEIKMKKLMTMIALVVSMPILSLAGTAGDVVINSSNAKGLRAFINTDVTSGDYIELLPTGWTGSQYNLFLSKVTPIFFTTTWNTLREGLEHLGTTPGLSLDVFFDASNNITHVDLLLN